MAIGTVQGFPESRNGKPQIKIDGAYYFVGRCDVSSLKKGDRIDFTFNTFGDNGKLKGLQNWALANGAPQTNGQMNGAAHSASALDDQDRPAISNWVAHAIAAGHIKSPTEIKAWALASQEALQALKGAKPAPRAPVSNGSHEDDGMPPYDDMPPEEPRGRW